MKVYLAQALDDGRCKGLKKFNRKRLNWKVAIEGRLKE
jgi:hypothetical protein